MPVYPGISSYSLEGEDIQGSLIKALEKEEATYKIIIKKKPYLFDTSKKLHTKHPKKDQHATQSFTPDMDVP